MTALKGLAEMVQEESAEDPSEVEPLDLEAYKSPKPSPCLPAGVSGLQLRKVVNKYLNENPANLHHGAAALVYGALDEAFPCPDE